MQLLIPKTALARVASRLRELAPELEIVSVSPTVEFEREGRGIPRSDVRPDLAWLSMDAALERWVPAGFDLLLGSAPLRWVQTFSAGMDRAELRALMTGGVRISKSDAQAASIAEYVTSHAFSLIVPIERQRDAQSRRAWTVTPYREIGDTRWTLVGFGAIGAEIARRVKAFDAHLTVVRRQPGDRGLADAVVPLGDIGTVLPETDVVVLACALNEQTRHLANRAFFDRLKPGTILVNIGRGALIDAGALRAGLDHGRPSHAVLDVFETEPLPPDDWMWDHPNLRVTAHTSAYGSGTMRRGDQLFLENLARFLRNEPLLNEAAPSEAAI